MRCIIVVFWIIILFSCGSGEETQDITITTESEPSYFPDALESRWVYKNPDGELQTWQIVDEKIIETDIYTVMDTTPHDPIAQSSFLLPTHFRLTEDKVLFNIREKIDLYIKDQLPLTVKDEFEGLDVEVVIDAISYPDFIFLQIPLIENVSWNALNLVVNGNFILQDLILVNIPIELQFNITGKVVEITSITTPAKTFENVYQITYDNEIIHKAFSQTDITAFSQTIWYVPHVGIVRIEDRNGISELVEYSLP